jgi:hypothetical protein
MLAMVVQGCGGDDNGMEVEVPPPDDDDGVDPVTELEEVKKERDKYKKMLDDMAAEEAREMDSEVTEALRGRINAVAPGAGTAMAPSLMASSDGMLTATQARLTQDDDFAEADAIDGFRGVRLTGSELVAYTDIDNAETKHIGLVYNAAPVGAGKPTAYYVDREDTVLTPSDPNVMAGDVPWSAVTRDGRTHTTTPEDTTTDPDTPAMTMFTGMVADVAGTFSCSGTACNVPSANSKGKVTDATNIANWTFTPTDAQAMIDVPDSDGYIVFGWWLTKNAKGLPSGVDVFTMVSGMDQRVDVTTGTADIEGTAKYSGGAAGKYALHNLGDGNSEAGHFTASATLTANFDADADTDLAAVGAVSDEEGVMISGMIDDFMTGDMERDWTVTLKMGDQDANVNGVQGLTSLGDGSTATAFAAGSMTTEWDIGGNAKGAGTWTVGMYGEDDDADTDANYPLAAVGEFDASLGTVGSIVGAFGATME